jgi:hypothetical protein
LQVRGGVPSERQICEVVTIDPFGEDSAAVNLMSQIQRRRDRRRLVDQTDAMDSFAAPFNSVTDHGPQLDRTDS